MISNNNFINIEKDFIEKLDYGYISLDVFPESLKKLVIKLNEQGLDEIEHLFKNKGSLPANGYTRLLGVWTIPRYNNNFHRYTCTYEQFLEARAKNKINGLIFSDGTVYVKNLKSLADLD